MSIPVIAIFDVGKTNKKLFLFDENYKIVLERTARFVDSNDEDGFPCENLESLRLSINNSVKEIFNLKQFKVNAVNFSTYGASLVYLDKAGRALTSLFSYLKPYPQELSKKFYEEFGGEDEICLETASPSLGSLNSGLQLYRMKYEKRKIFKKMVYALHLPQYLSFLLTGKCYSDITSIGCHTALWDFEKKNYHRWVEKEDLLQYLAPLESSESVFPIFGSANKCKVGIGLHDSSAALIPYLLNFKMPFVLISTGTWCISMNPFNNEPLTNIELKSDCLCYLQYKGEPVKSSRLHSGMEHEAGVQSIANYFQQDIVKYRNVSFDPEVVARIGLKSRETEKLEKVFRFSKRKISDFNDDIEAYHQLIMDLVNLQLISTKLVMGNSTVKRIYVDGGFSYNSVYMHLLARAFSEFEVFAASMAQATAIGAALAIHSSWSSKSIPDEIIALKYYSAH